ncbi:MAG: mechanosensitive ion channel [Bacteroidetes bacterium]|jgi:miniconductance mechanosensitive channel|nr:mechanosensitive ion channel [Bacteroidota bacterium]
METIHLQALENWLINKGFSEQLAGLAHDSIMVLIVLVIAGIADIITRKLLLDVIIQAVRKTKTTWDDILLEKRVFQRIAHIVPAIVIYFSTEFLFLESAQFQALIKSLCIIYILLITLLVAESIINGFHEIYNSQPISKGRSIKGYIQVIKIFLYFIVIISILAILLDKPLTTLLTGLGALAAVLILVFKDTILGFVASIQLSANKMVNVGDWISMPQYNADGNVTDISLNTIKVRNWDKTISTIPTYALVADSFQNWKGMSESGGRRIKRHLTIDMKSVKFCTPEMLKRFEHIIYLKDYIKQRQVEIEKYNRDNDIDESIVVNGRRMTNLGVFRRYIEFYLRNHPKIHQELTFMVRHLQPTDKGIPLEVYVFSNDQQWVNYESIQADIFDHLLAVIPEFELRVFQLPSGDDLRKSNATAPVYGD